MKAISFLKELKKMKLKSYNFRNNKMWTKKTSLCLSKIKMGFFSLAYTGRTKTDRTNSL